MDTSITSDLIDRVRVRLELFPELKKSHHFVFVSPLDRSYAGRTEYVWLSVHPGDGEDDWELCPCNTEETRLYNFQYEYGPSIGSQRRVKKLRWFLGDEMFCRTTLTMLFFWSVKDIGSSFTSKFGYTLNKHPHWDFCTELNLALINRLQPKAVFAESRPLRQRYEREFKLTPVATYYDQHRHPILEILRFKNGIHFYCFDNPSARRGHEEIRGLVHRFVANDNMH
ncbi:MAG: hypothetical protein OXG05_00420 [Gammaproteobacteria bacterium]|nr:hypothetical protein [Gammaproteobacteria bacterium]